MGDFRVTYDAKANAAYLYLTEPQAARRVGRMYPCDPIAVDGMINLNFDDDGRLIGVEVLGASTKLPRYVLDQAERID